MWYFVPFFLLISSKSRKTLITYHLYQIHKNGSLAREEKEKIGDEGAMRLSQSLQNNSFLTSLTLWVFLLLLHPQPPTTTIFFLLFFCFDFLLDDGVSRIVGLVQQGLNIWQIPSNSTQLFIHWAYTYVCSINWSWFWLFFEVGKINKWK